MINNKNAVYIILTLVVLFIMGILVMGVSQNKSASISSYEECVLAGYPVLETYPEQCKTPSGKTFAKLIVTPTDNSNPDNNMSDNIVIDNITAGQTITSPLVITGLARGKFYFEGSFPVKLLDTTGKVLVQTPTKAQSDWMTNDFVPFKVTLNFISPAQGNDGTLVFKNDNPSGLAENDREYSIPIKFTSPTLTYTKFDTNINMKVGDKITFGDSLVVSLKTIEDSRCKPGVQCVWAGELSPVLIVGKAQSEVRLGTMTKKSVTFGNYTFGLNSATATSANITVKKNNSLVGYLNGHVTVGPICPVEKVGEPCQVPESTYTGREALVYDSTKLTIKYRMNLDKNGDYKFTLPIGEYYVQIKPAGIGAGEMKYVKIIANTTSSVNFDIDTGIR